MSATVRKVTFRHPRTGLTLSGVVVGTQVQTGELLVERDDNGSREYVKPGALR